MFKAGCILISTFLAVMVGSLPNVRISTAEPVWWNIAIFDPNNTRNTLIHNVMQLQAINHRQQLLMREYPDLLAPLVMGARMAKMECETQLQVRRWNCSSTSPIPVFGKIYYQAYRETAFVYAMLAAGLTHAVARSCQEGLLQECSCPQEVLNKDLDPRIMNRNFQREGCGANIAFADLIIKRFTEEAESPYDSRAIAGRHNSNVGRSAVRKNLEKACKCFGTSGACSVRNCWMMVAPFREIGAYLASKVDSALYVEVDSVRRNTRADHRGKRHRFDDLKSVAEDDLIYMEESPSFCDYDVSLNLRGTTGRICNHTTTGLGSCDYLCCGRGYRTRRTVMEDTCRCLFRWCCEVRCQVCRSSRVLAVCS